MAKLVAGAVLLFIAFGILLAAATFKSQRPGPGSNLMRLLGYAVALLALFLFVMSTMVVINPGEVGVFSALL